MTRRFFAVAIAASAACGCVFGPGGSPQSTAPANATLKTAGGPLVQAHRGGKCEYDDNAAGGFKWCLDRGVRGFEEIGRAHV